MYKLERIKRRVIRVLYKLNFASIVSISALMISLGWLKFIYSCINRLLCITHKAIHRGFPEYLSQSKILFRVKKIQSEVPRHEVGTTIYIS